MAEESDTVIWDTAQKKTYQQVIEFNLNAHGHSKSLI